MKKIFTLSHLIFFVFLQIGFSQTKLPADAKSKTAVLPPISFASAYKSEKNALLLDVRTRDEFMLGHLKGAVNYDFYKDDFKSQLSKLDKNRPVYLYCHSGVRSNNALQMMKEMGFKSVIDLQGGIVNWKKEGYPTVKENMP